MPGFPKSTPQVLNQFAIHISLPATIVLKLNGLEVNPGLFMLVLIPWIMVAFAFVSVRWIGKVLKWDPKLTGAVMLCTGLGNTSFFGFPAVSIFLGEKYLAHALIYDQFGTFMALVIFGTLVVAAYGEQKDGASENLLLRILKFPPFIAMMVGFACIRIVFPEIITVVLEGLSATLIPIVTFSVGSVLVFRQPAENAFPIAVTMVLKMLVGPLIAFLLLYIFKIGGPVFVVGIFQAAMPSMVMAGVIASAGNLRSDVSNAAIGFGILLALITLPVLSILIK